MTPSVPVERAGPAAVLFFAAAGAGARQNADLVGAPAASQDRFLSAG